MAAKDKKENADISFEDSMKSLEALVEVLENDSTQLEPALEAFEAGVSLTRKMQKDLALAEQKVNVLSSKAGVASSEPLDPDEDTA